MQAVIVKMMMMNCHVCHCVIGKEQEHSESVDADLRQRKPLDSESR